MTGLHLFLDANIYLSFYRLSDDDIDELQDLVTKVKSGAITLYLTEQARDEFFRNRDEAIADSLKAIRSQKLASSFPRMFVNHAGYPKLRETMRAYEEQRRTMLDEVTDSAVNSNLSADKLITELFKLAHFIALTADIWETAKRRYDLRNPPGKGRSYGDAVHWESLLAEVPDGQDLQLVTDDSDFKSKLDPSKVSEFLSIEWTRKKGSTVSVYPNLSSLFRDHFQDIKLLAKLEEQAAQRALAVKAVVGSDSFAQTHAAIKMVEQFSDFSPAEAEELIQASIDNSQINWIIEDDDVLEFYLRLVKQYDAAIDPGLLADFWGLLDEATSREDDS